MTRKQLRAALLAYGVQLDGSQPMDKPRVFDGADNPKPEHLRAVFDALLPLIEVNATTFFGSAVENTALVSFPPPPYKKAMQVIQCKVGTAIKAKGCGTVAVEYSAYMSDDNDVPIDNLDDIAATGLVRLIRRADGWTSGYKAVILENPTWLQATVYANEMILLTGDDHHIFFEGSKHQQKEEGVTHYEFIMGS